MLSQIKKFSFMLALLAFFVPNVYAALSVKAKAGPTWVLLTWNEKSGTETYDVYLGDVCLARVKGATEYKAQKLDSNENYSFSVACRDKNDKTLDAGFCKCKTTSYDGIYEWHNKTDNDNKGKVKDLVVRVETAHDDQHGQYYKVYMIQDGEEFRIFPLFEFGDPEINEWHKYKENSLAGRAYRENAGMFNSSSFSPSKWKVSKIVIDRDFIEAYIQTSVLSMNLITETDFIFNEDEMGNEYISMKTTSDQAIVKKYVFSNPNPGEGEAFILTKRDV